MTPDDLASRFEAVGGALTELDERRAVERLFDRDATLWSDDPGHRDVIADRLGWLDVAGGRPAWRGDLERLGDGVRDAGLSRAVLAGMGGSSLAPEVFAKVLGGGAPGLSLTVLDSTHPGAVQAALVDPSLHDTLVIVSSKSGTTEETRAFAALAEERLGASGQLLAITDPGSELADQGLESGWRAVLFNPSDIGGRYSALSLFGMAPAALIGVDVAAVWDRAAAQLDRCRAATPLTDNPGAVLGAFMGGLARDGRDKLTLLADPRLAPLGDWIEQLVAESTGKNGTGVVPVVGEPVGEPGDYGQDRAFVELRPGGQPVPGAAELAAAGHPVLTIDVGDVGELGAEFVRWEVSTALAAVLLGVNPFDEPNVSESKSNTRAVLADVAGGEALPEPEEGDAVALVRSVQPGDYVSVQCYLAPSEAGDDALRRLRTAVRDATGVATTVGWGPRFLHSTGQLHKGGPDRVVALQLVDAPTGGPPIPGKPYDFATLVRAQAVGDLRSLREHGRRVAQVGVEGPEAIDALTDRIAAALGR